MRFLLAAGALAAAILTTHQLPASAAPSTGTQYAGIIAQTLDAKSAYAGEPVTLTHVTSSDGRISNGTMYGRVTHAVAPGQGRPAQVQMVFTKLVLPGQGTYAVDGVVTGMTAQTKSNAGKEAVGAVAGMLVGNAIGKTVFHMSGGGFLGAAGGYLIAKNNRADMTVPAGSAVHVELRSVRSQAHY